MEEQKTKRAIEEKKRDEERKLEHEARKKEADKSQKAGEAAMEAAITVAQEAAAASKVVSPAEMFPRNREQEQTNLNKVIKLGGLEEDEDDSEMGIESAEEDEGVVDEDDEIRSPVKRKEGDTLRSRR
jgi:hypothetical protein